MSGELMRQLWRWKWLGLASAVATFALVMAYAATARAPFSAEARVSIGYVAAQYGALAPLTLVTIEDVDRTERHAQRQALPDLGLAAVCAVQGRSSETPYLHIGCSAAGRDEAVRRVTAVADAVVARHRERFELLLQPLRLRVASDERRLQSMLKLQSHARPVVDGERFLLAKEIVSLQESLEMQTLLRKLDRMTTLDSPPGVVVTEKRMSRSVVAAALVVSLAFGVFVSLVFAAAAIMRRSGIGGGSGP